MLHRLPLPDEAEIIRDVLGLRKRTEYSAEHLEMLRAAAWNGVEHQEKATTDA